MTPIAITTAWDIVSTPAGDVVVIIPPGPRPRSILAAGDGIYIGTDAQPIALERSRDMASIVAKARTVVVAEADEAIVRETLVAVRTDPRSFRMETEDGLRAA